MKKIISIITLISIAILPAYTVQASSAQAKISGGKDGSVRFVVIEGVTNAKGENVSIQILKPNVTVTSDDTNYASKTAFSITLTSDDYSKYKITVPFSDTLPDGEYIINIKPASSTRETLRYPLVPIAVLNDKMDDISISNDVATVKNAILEYAFSIGIQVETPAFITDECVSMFIKNRNDAKDGSPFTESELNELLTETCSVYEIKSSSNSSVAANLAKYGSVLNLPEKSAYKKFEPSQTVDIPEINTRFATYGDNYTTFSGVVAEYETHLLLYVITRSWYDAKNVILDFGTFLGLDTSLFKNSSLAIQEATARRLTASKTIMTKSDLQREFPVALQAAINDSQKGGGNGGGGGGGGGGMVTINKPAEEPVLNPEQPQEPNSEACYFGDVEDETPWAVEAVNYLFEMGLISENFNMTYRPSDNITREEFTKLAVLMAGVELAEEDTSFADVNTNEWYAVYVGAAKKYNVVNGMDENTFGIGRMITRQDMAVMIYRALLLNGFESDSGNLSFGDSDNIADYARTAIECLANKKVLNGNADGNFYPENNCTRAETAQVIFNALMKTN